MQHVLPTLLGLTAGILGAYWAPLRPSVEPHAATESVGEALPRREPTVPDAPHVVARAPIEVNPVTPPSVSPPTATSRHEAGPRLTAEESALHVQQEFRRELDQHARDARDASWAAGAEASLRESLKELAITGQLERVECKTTSCVATLNWPDRDAAAQSYRQLLAADYEPNCGVRTLLPDAGGSGSRYQSQLVFDCVAARAN